MNSRFRSLIACAALLWMLTACENRGPDAGPPIAASSPQPGAAALTDNWIGKWSGPEGSFLQLAGGGGTYQVTVQNLDGPRIFQGKAAGDRIEFERDGVKETLRATNGEATGMKWLLEKSNCLTVRAGEGYCRDKP